MAQAGENIDLETRVDQELGEVSRRLTRALEAARGGWTDDTTVVSRARDILMLEHRYLTTGRIVGGVACVVIVPLIIFGILMLVCRQREECQVVLREEAGQTVVCARGKISMAARTALTTELRALAEGRPSGHAQNNGLDSLLG